MKNEATLLPPISVTLAGVLLGSYLLWFVLTGVIPLFSGNDHAWWFMGFNVLIGIPVYMLMDNGVACIRLDEEGICRRGLFNRQEKLKWADVSKITLHSGRGHYREIFLISRKKTKFALTTTRIKVGWTTMRRGFWPAVWHVMAEAQAREIPVKTTLGTHRESWFAAQTSEKPRIKP